MTKVGDTVWRFDQNRRVYREGRGGPVWIEHWVAATITGETSRSWIVGPTWNQLKIPKKGHDPRKWAFSREEIERQAWVIDERARLSALVVACRDYDTLKRVALALGEKV